jgi:hypothetical protein
MLHTLWVAQELAAANPICISDIVITEWPQFKDIPTESRHAREARWTKEHPGLAIARHQQIMNRCLKVYTELFNGMTATKDIRNTPDAMLDAALVPVMEELALYQVHVSHHSVWLEDTKGCSDYLGLTVTYSWGTKSHSFSISNLSPLEYALRFS